MEIKNFNDAINVLIQGVQVAQSKGVYSLQDAKIICEAMDLIESISEKKKDKSKETNEKIEESKEDLKKIQKL